MFFAQYILNKIKILFFKEKKMKKHMIDILLRKLDSYINPKIENRVIYGSLFCGVSLLVTPKLLSFIASIYINLEHCIIKIENSTPDRFSMIAGVFLIFISVITLYVFKIHKRPEMVISGDSKSARLWRKCNYSFQHEKYIHPLLIKELSGNISDKGRQVVSLDIPGSNCSNKYFGEISSSDENERKLVEVKNSIEVFGYEYLGTSESGIHVIHAYDKTAGTATFHWILLLQIEECCFLEYHENNPLKVISPVLKLVGRLDLGDRYCGRILMERGIIRISEDNSHLPEHLVNHNKSIVVK